MVRSMYSGVAGMKAHQTRMDVIGNNIANVNTYGFKSSRATFRDMYYQSVRGAAAATTNRGGINPSSVGYGASISSVDLLMGQSTMTPTGNPLDVAITGEGFLQVMDNDGNIFYTKAGMLDIDAAGNLIDSNGYFVLGTSGNPLGVAPGSNKIQFSIPSVSQKAGGYAGSINGKAFTITAGNPTKEGNVNFNFSLATDLPLHKRAEAVLDGTGNITVRLNSNEVFANMADLTDAVNDAITEANKGAQHPAGSFTLDMDPDFANLTGAQLVDDNFGYVKGSVTVGSGMFGGFGFVSVGDKFSSSGAITYSMEQTVPDVGDAFEEYLTITAVVDGKTYSAQIKKSQMASAGSVLLKNEDIGADKDDTITLTYPKYDAVIGTNNGGDGTHATPYTWADAAGTAAASVPSKDLGLGGSSFKLTGGTVGGPQTIKDLTGIAIGSDGTINASHAELGNLVIGRIDLATFDNPKGLVQSGNSYFAWSQNSGEPGIAIPGEHGTGALKGSALEMSNVDLSQEFSDMITTQRGFQANSRLITVSDTMLEELINLKR